MEIYSKKELQRKTIFLNFLLGVELATSESAVQCLIHWATVAGLDLLLLIYYYLTVNVVSRPLQRFKMEGSSRYLRYLRSVSIMLATATPQ